MAALVCNKEEQEDTGEGNDNVYLLVATAYVTPN